MEQKLLTGPLNGGRYSEVVVNTNLTVLQRKYEKYAKSRINPENQKYGKNDFCLLQSLKWVIIVDNLVRNSFVKTRHSQTSVERPKKCCCC